MVNSDVVTVIKEALVRSLNEADYKMKKAKIAIEHPSEATYGDYSASVAMSLAKELKLNPLEIAKNLLSRLEKDERLLELVDKIEVAGNGFINFYLKEEYLVRRAEEINYFNVYSQILRKHGDGKTVIIDYSAPNIAKPFGIGHLRSTNIGQALYNLYKSLGWSTIGDNHLGDWGTQFGKLIVAIKKWGKGNLGDMSIADLESLYVKFHAEAEKDENLVLQGREWFTKLEQGDKQAKVIWQKCIDISMQEFDRVYEMLGVKIDFSHGESFYLDGVSEIIKEFHKLNLVKKSEGAEIIEFVDLPPAILVKTNGASTYFARDLATIRYRMKQWNPDLIIYEVGADQNLYFKQVFAAARMIGLEPKDGFVHIGHGLIRWNTGKFSTRKGDTIHLQEVIDRAKAEALKIADKSTVSKEMDQEEKNDMVNKVALGAIKFSDLSADPKKDIIFDWDKIMSLEGDSGPYLQYTYARALSVLNKSRVKESKNYNAKPVNLNQSEVKLLRNFYKLDEKITESAQRFSPAVLAEYLLDIARKYNEFYANNKIVGSDQENFRIFLTRTTATILEKGLEILGIEKVERM